MQRVIEIRRLAGETIAVFGIVLMLAPEKVRRVGDIRVRCFENRERVFRGTDDVRRAARAGSVLERVARATLRGVHANRHRVICHTRSNERDAGLQRFGAGFACEFPITRENGTRCANRFGDHRGRRLDRVRMRFTTDPHRAQLLRINLRALERIACRFNAHRHRVFVETGDSFFFDGQSLIRAAPHARDLFRANAKARHIRAIADNSHGAIRFHY